MFREYIEDIKTIAIQKARKVLGPVSIHQDEFVSMDLDDLRVRVLITSRLGALDEEMMTFSLDELEEELLKKNSQKATEFLSELTSLLESIPFDTESKLVDAIRKEFPELCE